MGDSAYNGGANLQIVQRRQRQMNHFCMGTTQLRSNEVVKVNSSEDFYNIVDIKLSHELAENFKLMCNELESLQKKNKELLELVNTIQ